MPLDTTGSVGTEVPADVQVRWAVRDATFEPDGHYGPDIELDLDILTEEFFGTSTKYWARIQQPRLDKVRKLRKEDLDDETIATVLKKQGFEFSEIDEPDKMVIGRGGALYTILTAVESGDRKKGEKVLQDCDSFHDLAAHLKGGTFVGTTKLSKDGYVRLDATEEIFPDRDSTKVSSTVGADDPEEDFDDIPF